MNSILENSFTRKILLMFYIIDVEEFWLSGFSHSIRQLVGLALLNFPVE